MIPFDELIHALERYRRRLELEALGGQPDDGAQQAQRAYDPSTEYALDDFDGE